MTKISDPIDSPCYKCDAAAGEPCRDVPAPPPGKFHLNRMLISSLPPNRTFDAEMALIAVAEEFRDAIHSNRELVGDRLCDAVDELRAAREAVRR